MKKKIKTEKNDYHRRSGSCIVWYVNRTIDSVKDIIKYVDSKGKGSPYSITERRVPELIPVLGSQPAGEVSHKSGSRLPLLSARPAV